MKPFELREYESLQIGDAWDPANRTVPAYAVSAFERLQTASRREIFKISRRSIIAQQFVGTVGINGHAIDILPKVDCLDSHATREKLMEMLAIAGMVPQAEAGIAGLAQCSTLLDAFMRLYVRKLATEWRRGHIASYKKHQVNRTCLKGKLLFGDQLQKNVLHPERFFTSADEFLQDVAIPRLLRAGLQVCRRCGVNNETKREAMELLAEFDEVSDYGFCDAQIDAIVVDRQTGRFASLVELAKLFLKGRTPDCVGLGETYSLVFDMNVVFERLVGNMLRRHACPLGHVTTLQFAGKSLFRTQNGPRFCLKPDIGLSRGGNLVCLFDTKWKRLDAAKPNNNVSQADMYQMYAYGKEYKSSTVFLIYPYSGPLSLPTEYCCNDHTSTVKIRQIDLSQPLFGRRGSVCEQLRGLATEI